MVPNPNEREKKENILFQSTATAVSDLMFALIAGVAIMPAVFAFGLNPQSGPGLVFETLPYVFGQMPAGGVVAILFFLALLVAALTMSVQSLEMRQKDSTHRTCSRFLSESCSD